MIHNDEVAKNFQKKRESFKTRLQKAHEFVESDAFEKITSRMNDEARRFFESQLDCARKRTKGRRFSLEDKIMSLALYLNQDPLEIFFGKIRQRGMRFINPACSAFGPFYKSLLVNNLVSKHSAGSNCEDDRTNILLPLQKFIKQGSDIADREKEAETTSSEVIQIPKHFEELKSLESCAVAYVDGYLTKLKLSVGKCEACKFNVLKREGENYTYLHDLVKAREYDRKNYSKLKYSNQQFTCALVKIYSIVRYILKQYPHKSKLLDFLITNLKKIC